MVYKRKGRVNARENWYVWITLPRWGRVGPFSTGTTDRKRADRMEKLLADLATDRPELVEALLAKHFTLPELWIAKVTHRLDELAQMANDPPLEEAVESTRPHVQDRRTGHGLGTLLALAPAGVRLSWLANPKNVNDLLAKDLARGTKPNSVARSLSRAVIEVLTYHYGRKFRLEVYQEVRVPKEDDARRVDVSPEQLRRVLDECDDQMRDLVLLAMLTAVDQTPLTLILPRHFDEARQTLRVFDRKTKARQRTLELSDVAAAVLRRAMAGKAPDERVFSLSASQVGDRWKYVRQRAGVPHLRFKDLRHLLPTFWMALGYSPKDLMGIMGHTQIATTMGYATERVVGDRERLNRVASMLGLDREHLRVRKGGA